MLNSQSQLTPKGYVSEKNMQVIIWHQKLVLSFQDVIKVNSLNIVLLVKMRRKFLSSVNFTSITLCVTSVFTINTHADWSCNYVLNLSCHLLGFYDPILCSLFYHKLIVRTPKCSDPSSSFISSLWQRQPVETVNVDALFYFPLLFLYFSFIFIVFSQGLHCRLTMFYANVWPVELKPGSNMEMF